MRAVTRPSLVPRRAHPDKWVQRPLRTALVALCLGACGGPAPSMARHEVLHTISLLDAGERGHFLRPDPRPVRKTRSQRPAGPANANLYRAAERKKVAYAPRKQDPARRHGTSEQRAAQRIEAARAFLGTAGLSGQPFVAQVLRSAGQDIGLPKEKAYAATLHGILKQRGALLGRGDVRPGDLVFFRDTLDLNDNGKPDDGITFVALVEQVEDSRVVFIGQRAGRVRRMALHLASPDKVRDGAGQVINTRLVRWPGSARPLTAARCFATWARP